MELVLYLFATQVQGLEGLARVVFVEVSSPLSCLYVVKDIHRVASSLPHSGPGMAAKALPEGGFRLLVGQQKPTIIILLLCLLCLRRQLMEMQRELERAVRSRTWLGHLQNLIGYITSGFCVFKCGTHGPICLHSSAAPRMPDASVMAPWPVLICGSPTH